MRKTVLRCAAFVCILALLLGGLSWVFYPKIRDWDHGMNNPRIWSFQSEPENSLDVLAIGDSLLMCGYSPLHLWKQAQITGFNACTGNQRLTQSLRMLEEFCREQSPKAVLLEADSLFQTVESKDFFLDRIASKIPVLEYHDNWKIFSPKNFLRSPDYSFSNPEKGTHFLYDRDPELPKDLNYMEDRGETAAIDRVNLFYFQRIAAFCQKRNIQLVLVSVPSPTLWSLARHNAVQALADSKGIVYLDMNLEDGLIDWSTDRSTEGDHLNYLGTRKVTAFLGEYLQSTGLFPVEHPSEVRQAWDTGFEALEANIARHLASGEEKG